MDHFEKALHAAIQQRMDMWQWVTGPATETPDVQALYPLEDAFQSPVCMAELCMHRS